MYDKACLLHACVQSACKLFLHTLQLLAAIAAKPADSSTAHDDCCDVASVRYMSAMLEHSFAMYMLLFAWLGRALHRTDLL